MTARGEGVGVGVDVAAGSAVATDVEAVDRDAVGSGRTVAERVSHAAASTASTRRTTTDRVMG